MKNLYKNLIAITLSASFLASFIPIPANALVYNVQYPTFNYSSGYSGTSNSDASVSDSSSAITEAQYTTYPYSSTGYGYSTGSTYYPTTGYGSTYPGTYSGACVNLSRALTYGITGTDVSALQQFLINQGLLATGLITGYFGGATMKAVETFQYDHDIPATGTVGTETIQAIQVVSCGAGSGSAYPYGTTYPVSPTYPTYPTYPSGYGYGTPVISSLSSSSGSPGMQITIYGSGFDPYNNTVTFAGQTESGIASINGTQLTFAVPYLNSGCSSYPSVYNGTYPYTNSYPYSNCSGYNGSSNYNTNQTYQVTVSDSRGTSNPTQFTLISSGTNTTCPYNSSYYGCTNYNNGYGTNGNPAISYITPTIGDIGTLVTIYGSGFSYNDNTVHIGQGEILNVGSSNGTNISFTLPQYLNSFCQTGVYCANEYSQTLTTGSYSMYVSNSSGYNSNTEPFTVSNGGTIGNNGSLSISNLNGPTTLNINQNGTWNITVFDQNSGSLNTSVSWGDGQSNVGNQTSQYYSGGQSQTLSFSHTYSNTGTYTITYTLSDSYGSQASASQTVYVQ